jgi:heme exporter protein B
MVLNRIIQIIRKDFLIDSRDKYSYLSSLLYLTAITFVVYKVFDNLNGPTRIGIFWVLLVFTAINIVSHSFSYHSQKRKLYYYQLYKPEELITAKLIGNVIKLFLAGIILAGLQFLFSNEWIKDSGLFFQSFGLAVIGIVAILTLSSALASYAQDQTALVSVLSLPLLIPILLLAMRVSLIADRMFVDTAVNNYLLMLLGIDILLISLTIIFIPIIWKS